MDRFPFAVNDELYEKLSKSAETGALIRSNNEKSYLPGRPRIQIQNTIVESHLESELMTKDLDKLVPHLWLVGKQDSTHISSLTHQRVRGREIVITENPELHLLWIYERVFNKPLPNYLLSHSFWEFYLSVKARTSRTREDIDFRKPHSDS